jgi:levanase/fructan beta-fructosidase
MSNWEYANVVPTTKWRSAMTLARELELVENQNGFRLRSKAPSEWEAYTSKVLEKESISAENETLLVEKGSVDLSAAQVSLNLVDLNNKKYTFQLENTMGEVLSFGIDQEKNQFFIDRSKSGETNFSETFSIKPSVAPRTAKSTALDIQFILDKMSLEVFYDKGETVMTEIFFSQAPFETLRLNTTGNSIKIEDLQILELSKN